MSKVLLPCYCEFLLPCTAGRDPSHCHSPQSTFSVCDRNCPFFLAKRVPHPSHAAFSVQNNRKQAAHFQTSHMRQHKSIRDHGEPNAVLLHSDIKNNKKFILLFCYSDNMHLQSQFSQQSSTKNSQGVTHNLIRT